MQYLKLTDHEKQLFDIYFIGIVSMARNHPGAGMQEAVDVKGKGSGTKWWEGLPSMQQCSQEALDMIMERRRVFGEA